MRPKDASQQGGGPKRSLDLGIPAEKKTLYRQEGTTEPELTNFSIQTFQLLLRPVKAIKATFKYVNIVLGPILSLILIFNFKALMRSTERGSNPSLAR